MRTFHAAEERLSTIPSAAIGPRAAILERGVQVAHHPLVGIEGVDRSHSARPSRDLYIPGIHAPDRPLEV